MNAVAMLIAFPCFAMVAIMTWYFSYRPRQFLRTFVPRDEIRGAIHGILRNPNFGRSMRVMALLQFGVAAIFGTLGLWLLLG